MTEYRPTNRERNREADRRRMRVTGRGVVTVLTALEHKRERERRAKEVVKCGGPT